jgi:alpha-amylase/alpha-mannosidase (GH57 family)
MNEKIWNLLIPLSGVVLGWLLGSITNFSKQRRDEKVLLGKAIAELIVFYIDLRNILSTYETFKDASKSWEEYEKFRQVVNSRFIRKKPSYDELYNMLENVSGILPIEGMKLKSIVSSFSYYRTTTLSTVVDNEEESYLKMLSIYEAIIEVEILSVKKILLKLSYRHSLSQWFKTRNFISNTGESSYEKSFREDFSSMIRNEKK